LIAELPARVTAAGYTPGGTLVTAGDGLVRFWTANGHELGAVPSGQHVDRLVIDPTGRWLFASDATSSVLVIDAVTRAPIARLEVGDKQIMGLATNDSCVAITDGATVRRWRLGTWAPMATLVGHKGAVWDVWFLPDGRLVSTAFDGTLVWGSDASLLKKLTDTTFALATTPDRTLFATTGSNGTIRVWDAITYRLLLQRPGRGLPAYTLQLTHDGSTAISGGDDGRLVTWQLTRTPRSAFELARIVRCRVPLRLDGDVVLPRDLDFDDLECHTPALGQ
jgi:WD40 repeat protein